MLRAQLFCVILILAFLSLTKGTLPGFKKIESPTSKYNQREVLPPDHHVVGMDATEFSTDRPASKCYHDVDILWHRKLDTSVFGTPLITDMFADGQKEIIIAGLDFIYSLSGADGDLTIGSWPVGLDDDEFIASPLEFDIQGDGVEEIVVCTRNGRIIFVSEEGYVDVNRMLQVPPTYIHKYWYKNYQHPANNITRPLVPEYQGFDHSERPPRGVNTPPRKYAPGYQRRPIQTQEIPDQQEEIEQELRKDFEEIELAVQRQKQQSQESQSQQSQDSEDSQQKSQDSQDSQESQKLPQLQKNIEQQDIPVTGKKRALLSVDDEDPYNDADYEQAVEREERLSKEELYHLFSEKLTPDGKASLELFLPAQADIRKDMLDWSWAANYKKWFATHPRPKDLKSYLEVPAHILAPPVIADIENDGEYELVVPVSYYFEHWLKLYKTENEREKSNRLDLSKYVACGIVVFSLKTLEIKWNVLLDLTMDENGDFKGTIYGPPTVIDLDGDGELEIIVGTTSGFIYVLNSRGVWDTQINQMVMDSIFGGITVEDIDGDGFLEIIVADSVGNIVCFNHKGEEIWENQIVGEVYHNPVIGDVNGDGVLDVVVASTGSAVYALRGDNGKFLAHFPVKLHGPVLSQPILLKMAPRDVHLHVVVHDYSGHVYVIDSLDACVERLDIGGHSVTSVVSDDLNGNGFMDLVVTTLDGDVYVLGTEAPHDPLETWPSYFRNRNSVSMTTKQGIRVDSSTRSTEFITGQSFRVGFDIIDNRGKDKIAYNVKILSGSDILFNQNFTSPGSYSVTAHAPERITSTVVKVRMTNEHGQTFYDSFHVSFNGKFYKSLKWILVFPFLTMCAILLCLKELGDYDLLPS